MPYDSIIFDLDGTLWDTVEPVVEAWNEAIQELNISRPAITRKDIMGLMGLSAEELFDNFLTDLSSEQQQAVMRKGFEKEHARLNDRGGNLFPKVEETLTVLGKEFPLFVVSNCQEGYMEAFLNVTGFRKYFKDYETHGKTGRPKGENIRSVIERNDLKKPVYVGDTEGDRVGAEFAGIDFYYAAYGFGRPHGYTKRIDRFSDLVPLLCSKE